MKEFIICSAIHIHDGRIHTEQPLGINEGFIVAGRRHGDCYRTIKNLRVVDSALTNPYEIEEITPISFTKTESKDMGFITNTNRFVGRREAMKIAIETNQLLNPKLHEGKSEDDDMFILTSEDLFLDII